MANSPDRNRSLLNCSVLLFFGLALSTLAAAQPKAAAPAQREAAPQTPAVAPERIQRIRVPLQIDLAAARQAERPPATELHRQKIQIIRQKLDQAHSRVPVLMPTDQDLAAKVEYYPSTNFFTLRSNVEKMALTVHGSAHAFQLPPNAIKNLPPGGLKQVVPADGILSQRNESGGIDVTINRFGVTYSMSLECDDGAKDPRCADDNYARGVIQRLAVVAPREGQ